MQCREQPLQLITARIVSADIPGALRLGGFVQRQRLPRLILELIHADTALREHSAHRRDRRHGVAPARVMSEVNDRLGQLGGRDAILERFIRIVAKLTRLPADNQSERVRSRRSSAGRFHTSPKRRARVPLQGRRDGTVLLRRYGAASGIGGVGGHRVHGPVGLAGGASRPTMARCCGP